MSTSIPADAPRMDATPRSFDRIDALRYVALVTVWGTSWIAIHGQLGVVSPIVSLLWRFLLASGLCWALALFRGERLRFPARIHALFAAAGVLMFSTNFVFFYFAGLHVATGLLAVVFALASPINLGLAALFFGRPVEPRVLGGAAIGVAGVGLLYAPEITGTGFDATAASGLAMAVVGTLCFCLGNMVSARIQREEVGDLSTITWGMTYGALWLLALTLLTGARFEIEWTPLYLVSLFWLAAGASVVAFLTYLALIKRIGPARAGFATVLFPVVALAISSVFEGYRWGPLGVAGIALVAVGNVVVLGLAKRKS